MTGRTIAAASCPKCGSKITCSVYDSRRGPVYEAVVAWKEFVSYLLAAGESLEKELAGRRVEYPTRRIRQVVADLGPESSSLVAVCPKGHKWTVTTDALSRAIEHHRRTGKRARLHLEDGGVG